MNITLHSLRRLPFLLPLISMGFSIASDNPPTPITWLMVLAACIGFLGYLTVSESIALVTDAFDLSDLGLSDGEDNSVKNDTFGMLEFSSLTRVTAGFTGFKPLRSLLMLWQRPSAV